MDEIRITKGLARWTSNFTPDTAPYDPITNVAPETPTLNNFNNGNSTTDTTPTLDFDLADNDAGDLIKYQLQVDNNSDFSSPEIDFTEADFSAAPRAGTEYNVSGIGDGTWYWRVKAIDDEGLESDWATASLGFKIDTDLPSSKILYPQNGGELKGVKRIVGNSTDSDGVDFTRISLKNESTGMYYNGSDFTESAETWLTATALNDDATATRWFYAFEGWSEGVSYTIRSRATDLAGNEEHTDAITFTFTVNGSQGSIYVSNPAVNNNSDYKIYYPNTGAIGSGGSVVIDFDDTFRFSPWMEGDDVTLSNQSDTIASSTDSIDRQNKTITSTITAGNVGADDMVELEINNLRIHNPSLTGSYDLTIRLYNSVGGLIEAGTGVIVLEEVYQQVELNVDVQQSLQLSVDSGSVLLSVDPDVQNGQNWDGTGGTVTEKTAVEVKTNAQSGYNLMISLAGNTATGAAVLDGTTNTGNTITSTTANRVSEENNFSFSHASGSLATGTAFTNTATQISGAGQSAPTNSNTDDIFYYLNVDYDTPSDVYLGTVTYTAIGQF